MARGIVRWVREVAADPEAGYAASQDADVGLDDDGDYFTWTREEAAAVLSGDELDVAAAYYDIGTAGEMHHNPGKNVLFVAAPLPAVARLTGLAEDAARLALASARRKLLEARDRRTAPFVDRTRYANWNAMMASAMLRAGAVLGDEWARRHALATLELLGRESPEPDAVPHTPGGITGLLDDQVQVAAAALDAYETTGDHEWLAWAERIMERVWRDYWDEGSGGFFDTARDREGEEGLLPARVKPVQDTPTPSPNGVAGITLVRLHQLTGEARWRERAGAGGGLRRRCCGARAPRLRLSAGAGLVPQSRYPPRRDRRAGRLGRRRRCTGWRWRGFAPRRVVQRLTPAEAEAGRLPAAIAACSPPPLVHGAMPAWGRAAVCRWPQPRGGISCYGALVRHPERSEGTMSASSPRCARVTGTTLP